jgi:hypothetical protein
MAHKDTNPDFDLLPFDVRSAFSLAAGVFKKYHLSLSFHLSPNPFTLQCLVRADGPYPSHDIDLLFRSCVECATSDTLGPGWLVSFVSVNHFILRKL